MPELIYIKTVSEQCKADSHLDCIGRFQDGETEDKRPIWRRCDCDCSHPSRWKVKRADVSA